MLRVYDILYDTLENTRKVPRYITMDNEASEVLNQLLQKNENSGTISATT